MKKFLRPRIIIIFVVVILVGLGIFSLITQSNAPKLVSVITPVIEDLTVTITGGGKIQPQNASSLHFAASGRISQISVKEGDHVKAGQTLAYINGSDFKEQENKAWLDYKYQLDVIREFEKAALNKPQDEDYLIAKSKLETQKEVYASAIAQVRNNYSNRTLIAPFDGQVSKIYKLAGDVTVGDAVLDLQSDSELEFIAEIDEQDIGNVTTDQKVEVTLDAYQDQTIPAQIIKIENNAKVGSTGSTYFPVHIKMPNDQSYALRNGMNGDCSIITASKTNVLTIPIELINEENNQKYVYTYDNGQVQKVTVQTGLQNDTSIEIISDLSQATKLISSDTTNLKVNDKITIKI